VLWGHSVMLWTGVHLGPDSTLLVSGGSVWTARESCWLNLVAIRGCRLTGCQDDLTRKA
jgi:hypothetical protein